MSNLNPPYASSASVNWKKIVFDILKYAIGAIVGGVGVASTSGCTIIPFFNI